MKRIIAALILCIVSTIAVMDFTYRVRGYFAVGSEVVVPIILFIIWNIYDSKRDVEE